MSRLFGSHDREATEANFGAYGNLWSHFQLLLSCCWDHLSTAVLEHHYLSHRFEIRQGLFTGSVKLTNPWDLASEGEARISDIGAYLSENDATSSRQRHVPLPC